MHNTRRVQKATKRKTKVLNLKAMTDVKKTKPPCNDNTQVCQQSTR